MATPKIQSILGDPDSENGRTKEAIVTVRKRYREFVLLQDGLRTSNLGIIMPPLPPATIHSTLKAGKNFVFETLVYPSRELMEKRTVLLQRFMDNLLAHPKLAKDPMLLLFIQSIDFKSPQINDPVSELAAQVSILQDSPRYPDALEDRLDYLMKVTNRMEILKIGLLEYFAAKQNLADRITGVGKSITGYLDATTDSGNHGRLVQLIDSLDTISELIAFETEQTMDAKSFVIVVDDYLRMMKEVEQAFSVKRSLRSIVYTIEVQLIDLQASLTKSKTDTNRNFDKNYRLSEKFLEKREGFKRASDLYNDACKRLNGELDRIDCRRMLEIENCIDHLLRNLLNAQVQVMDIWESFLDANQSIASIDSESKTAFAL